MGNPTEPMTQGLLTLSPSYRAKKGSIFFCLKFIKLFVKFYKLLSNMHGYILYILHFCFIYRFYIV